MPSKGIQCYTYIAVPGYSITLSVPQRTVVKDEIREFWNDDLEVEAWNACGLFSKTTRRFAFKVCDGRKTVTKQWVDVNPFTGKLGDGTLKTIANTHSVIYGTSSIVSYGFYAAGDGEAGLPNKHQCYVTVAPNYSGWMGLVTPPGSPLEDRPFSRMVLPSAHDVGMNSMENSNALIGHAGGAVISLFLPENPAFRAVVDAISGPTISAIAPDIVFSMAITEKDSLKTMLQLGARYFEFRPAHCLKEVLPARAIPDDLYFQHGGVPGMAYRQFLQDLACFLVMNPTEIAVVHLRWDGVPAQCARPSDEELKDYLDAALTETNGALTVGSVDDLKNHTTISQLRRDKKRLIFMRDVDALSTYTDAGNSTLNGDGIIGNFDRILQPGAEDGKPLIEIQCQATATNVPGAVVYSVLSASPSTSCLLSTKAICDSKTLPWIRDNALARCGKDALVVAMNDFFDGATADVAINLSKQRLE